jgi:clan AA aspartic protease
MGFVADDFTLKNNWDVTSLNRGVVDAKDVRAITVNALVDTGTETLVINEAVRLKLGLYLEEECPVILADGKSYMCSYTEPLRVMWHGRQAVCRALVLPDADDILIGVIPLEDMDLMVDLPGQRLLGVHGDKVIKRVKSLHRRS